LRAALSALAVSVSSLSSARNDVDLPFQVLLERRDLAVRCASSLPYLSTWSRSSAMFASRAPTRAVMSLHCLRQSSIDFRCSAIWRSRLSIVRSSSAMSALPRVTSARSSSRLRRSPSRSPSSPSRTRSRARDFDLQAFDLRLLLGACLAGSYRFAARRFDPAAAIRQWLRRGRADPARAADEHGLALGVDFELLDAPVAIADFGLEGRAAAPLLHQFVSRARAPARGRRRSAARDRRSVPGAG